MNLDFLPTNDVAGISEWRGNWDAILKESVIIGVTITQWYPHTGMTPARLAKLGLNAEDDEAKKAVRTVLHGGRIDLVPPAAYRPVQTAASRIRDNLTKHSLPVLWGYLVSANAYVEWKEKHDTLETAFWGAIDNLETNWYPQLAEARRHYEAMFRDAYYRIPSMGDLGQVDFVDAAVQDIVSDVPTQDEMRSKFSVTVNYSHAPMSDEIAESEARAIETRARIAGELETVEGKERVRADIVATMQAEVAIQVERRRFEVERSLAQAEDIFYKNIMEVANSLKQGLKERSGKLHGRGAAQLRNLVKQVKSLNVFDDEGLGEQVASLEALAERHFDSGSQDRGEAYEALEAALGGVSAYASTTLRALPQTRGIRRIADGGEVAVESKGQVTRRLAKDLGVPIVEAPTLSRRVQEAV